MNLIAIIILTRITLEQSAVNFVLMIGKIARLIPDRRITLFNIYKF